MGYSLKTLGLLSCLAKILTGTLYYGGIEFMKETCVPMEGATDTHCDGAGLQRFKRPFVMSFLLFFSMSFTLIPYFLLRHNKPGVTKVTKKTFIDLLVIGGLEFLGQVLFLFGASKIPMSLSLTLKGSRVVFSALFLILIMGRKLFAFHWFAIAIVLAGIVVASIPAVVKPEKGPGATEAIIGISLVLAGELIRSLRGVVEEKMLKKLRYDALLVVGIQGLYACILTIPLIISVNYIENSKGPLEEFTETVRMFGSSGVIIAIAAFMPFSVPGLFVAGAYVTKLMSAVHNALTTILTNGTVWIISIIVHYVDPLHLRGHGVELISLVQLTGFLMVLVASLIYDADIKLPCLFKYPLNAAVASGIGDPTKESYLNDNQTTTTTEEVSVEEGKIAEEDRK